jgi:hypothetical protein
VRKPTFFSAVAAIALSALPCFGKATPPPPTATPANVNAAIEKGQKFLLSLQKPDGGWEKDAHREGTAHNWEKMQGDSFGGFTAVAVYALLASGYNPQAPEIIKALDFLRKADVIGIYSLGLRANVWLLVPPTAANKDWLPEIMQKDRDRILNSINEKPGDNQAMWDYGTGKGQRLDHSVSQYGVLGLWACDRGGATVPMEVWSTLDAHWRADQFPDGGWIYDGSPTHKSKNKESASITAAGIATLFITQDYMLAQKASACDQNIENENLDKGLNWLSKNFKEVEGAYAWYGIERIGAASGLKYFGSHDWFKEGAAKLLETQKTNGSWEGGFPGSVPIPATSFALVFLARGQAAVLVNKLEYSFTAPASKKESEKSESEKGESAAHWNQRPRDAANLVHWFSEETETNMNWQIVNFRGAADFNDAPVLYIAGDQTLKFTSEDIQKLKDFVHKGGMIWGEADCGNEAFANSFEKLGTDMFGYEFRVLPADHPIFNEEFPAKKWRLHPEVLGLSNQVRELMLLVPRGDPARAWQVRAEQTHPEFFQLGADAIDYAIDKRPELKGITHIVTINDEITTNQSLKVARLKVGSNPDPEPGGWDRMAAIFHNDYHVDLSVELVDLQSDALDDFKVADLTGTEKLDLNGEQQEKLHKWVDDGGTLIIDAAGGNSAFAESTEAALKTMFGAAAEKGLAEPLPFDDSLYRLPELTIDHITYRPFARQALVGDTKIPRIRSIVINGRTAVFYSREDISAGLVGQNVDGIYGYAPDVATALMRNMLFAAGKLKPPALQATGPATKSSTGHHKSHSTKPPPPNNETN